MTRNTKSNFGNCTVWVNDGTDKPPQNIEAYWIFNSSKHGICMITKKPFPEPQEGKNVLGTVLLFMFGGIGFLDIIEPSHMA